MRFHPVEEKKEPPGTKCQTRIESVPSESNYCGARLRTISHVLVLVELNKRLDLDLSCACRDIAL